MGPVLDPHARTTPAQNKIEQRDPATRSKDGRPGEGERLTPDAPHSSERYPSRGNLRPPPWRAKPPQDMHAKGPVPGPHTRTAAPTAGGQQTPTACPKYGQPGEDEFPTTDAPHNGASHPLRERSPASLTARNAGSQRRTLWGRCWVPTPAQAAPRRHGQWDTATRPKDGQPRGGRRLTPDTPHNDERYPPSEQPPTDPALRDTPQGTHTKRPVPAPTPAHPRPQRVASGPQLPAPRTGGRERESAQPGLPSEKHGNAPRPPVGSVPGPRTHITHAKKTRATGPRYPAQG